MRSQTMRSPSSLNSGGYSVRSRWASRSSNRCFSGVHELPSWDAKAPHIYSSPISESALLLLNPNPLLNYSEYAHRLVTGLNYLSRSHGGSTVRFRQLQ